MRLFEKLGIVEASDKIKGIEEISMPSFDNDVQDMNYLEDLSIDTSNLVTPDDVYLIANLTDLSKSIYKVDEIRKVLPSSMTEETKKQSVIGMMQVSNITVEEVISDANMRTEMLLATLQESTCETENIIADGEARIRQYEEEIKALSQTIEDRKKLQEEQNKIINKELETISKIKEFIL